MVAFYDLFRMFLKLMNMPGAFLDAGTHLLQRPQLGQLVS